MTPEEIKKAQEDLQKLKDYFNHHSNRVEKAKIDRKGENKDFYPIEADESLRVQQEADDSYYKLYHFGKAISKHMNKELIDKINKRYQEIVKKNGWVSGTGDKELATMMIVHASDKEVRESYYRMVFEEFENNL